MKPPKRHDLIRITWLDAFVWPDSPWLAHDEVEDDPIPMVSVGYFVRQTTRFVVFAQTLTHDLYGGVFFIHVGCILKVEKL